MEFSPYLQAIQSIEGQTPGDKYQTLSGIARKIATEYTDVSKPIEIFPSDELPKQLIPWVKLEVGEILKRPEEIANALRSEDFKVFNRAIKVKWFFTGNIPNYSDVSFFVNQLFPNISLVNRLKIIKALGKYLRPNPELAEAFYVPIAAQYGYDIARPILIACKESFLWNKMIDHRILFNLGEIKYLYYKFPNLVINYLKKAIHEDYPGSPLHKIYIDKYKEFLPLLLNKHPQEFVEFIERSSTMGIRLNSDRTKLLLKVGIDALVTDPELFLPMLTKKDVVQTLEFSHYELIVDELFPDDLANLDFEEIKECFQYIPEEYRTSLISSTCIKKYGKKWTDNYQKITPAALRVLPPNDRIKLARKKLQSDPKWYTENNGEHIEKSWRCYLPIEESIPFIKAEIARSKHVPTKMILMRQLLLTCEINNDSKVLLSVLTYISTEYTYSPAEYTKKEEWELMDVLLSAIIKNSPPLKQEHWDVIYDYIQFLKTRQGTVSNVKNVKVVLINGIRFDLINNHSIKKKIDLLTEIYREQPWILNWNILQNKPRHEKSCIKEFSKSILKMFSKHHKENTHQWRETCVTFLKAIYDYNYRHYTKGKRIKNKLSIKKFPWLLESILKLMNQHSGGIRTKKRKVIDLAEIDDLLRSNEPDVLPPESLQAYTKKIKFFKWTGLQFIFNPQPVFHNYKNYYEECREKIRRRCTQKFLRFCRWHQDIPTKLAELALEDFKENREYEAIIVLGILLEGSEFERFITPHIPDPMRITSDLLLLATVEAIKYVNPMVSIDLIRQICDIGIDRIIIKCLFILRARMGANRVIPFCRELNHRNVNLFRSSMDATRIVAKLDEILPILRDCWEESKAGFDEDDIDDKNKRCQLIRNVLIILETKACSEVWQLVDKWLDELNVKDEEETLGILTMFQYVPGTYLGQYLGKVIITIRRLEVASEGEGHWATWFHYNALIDDFPLDAALLLPDYIYEFVISSYWDVAFTNRDLLSVAIQFFINSYILPAEDDDLDDRLDFFSKIFAQTLVTNWHIRQPTNNLWNSTIDYFLNEFTDILIFDTEYSLKKNKIIEEALNSFMSVLSPQDDPQFYCYFYFSSFYNDTISATEFIDRIHNILPIIFGYFTVQHIDQIAKCLHRLMKHYYDDEVADMIIHLLQKYDRSANCLAACLFLNEKKELSKDKFWMIFNCLRSSNDPFAVSRAFMAIQVLDEKK